ncbi:MAG TPA: hypothetical protein EYN60_07650 [Nitrospirales bacterium]|nr:hypothetical protein [Nitrospirales bacterium]HIA14946.1 hypothetical protein [Nitrospirales bacterium]HIC04398.1 hypothetical protein [Nitrospirales bacterium]HIN33177.1 hypothetical protein [Nitrospirales bacterium]HIO69643.1 hypothetical protein [Nitrospirales bacterium]
MRRCVAVCVCVVLALPTTLHARHLKVYSPFGPELGELEVSYWTDTFAETDRDLSGNLDRDGLLRHSVELEYGLTDKWKIAYYADFEHQTQGDDRFRYVQSRFESIYRLWDHDEQLFDAGLYVEFVAPRNSYDKHNEIEVKALLEKLVQDILVRFNPVFGREISSGDGFELGYETGWYYGGVFDAAWVGLEAFGSFGLIRSFERLRNQSHSIGPAALFNIGPLEFDTGFQFGLTNNSDDVVFKSVIAFEF